MPLYQFYSLDGRGRRIEPVTELDCMDDAAAIAHGGALYKDAKLGIWQGSREVRVLPPNAAKPQGSRDIPDPIDGMKRRLAVSA